ncbi:MAG: hypothetical protein VB140_03540 [Burkholderia sp.]
MLHKSSVRTKGNELQTSLVRNPFVSPEIMPVDAIASSRSIYATTPFTHPINAVNLPGWHRRAWYESTRAKRSPPDAPLSFHGGERVPICARARPRRREKAAEKVAGKAVEIDY